MARTRVRQRSGYRSVVAYYIDVFGDERSAGTFRCKCKGQHRNGKLRCRCDAEKKAQQLAEETELKARAGTLPARASTMTLNEYVDTRWFAERVQAENTLATHRVHYNHAIRPTLGKVRLCDLSPELVTTWLSKQTGTPNTVAMRLITLRAILVAQDGACAMQAGLLERDPLDGVRGPRRKKRKKKRSDMFSAHEALQVLEALDPWWRPMALTQAETALRWGELQGLQLRALDGNQLDTCRVVIELTKKELGGNDRFKEREEPKDHEDRYLTLSDDLAAQLRAVATQRRLQPTDRLFPMPDPDDPDVPLRTELWPNGQPVSRSYWRRRWINACEAAGVRYRVPYALRGSNATWMIDHGASVTDVMRRLGHSRLETVLSYLAMNDTDANGLAAVERALAEAKAKVTRLDHRDTA